MQCLFRASTHHPVTTTFLNVSQNRFYNHYEACERPCVRLRKETLSNTLVEPASGCFLFLSVPSCRAKPSEVASFCLVSCTASGRLRISTNTLVWVGALRRRPSPLGSTGFRVLRCPKLRNPVLPRGARPSGDNPELPRGARPSGDRPRGGGVQGYQCFKAQKCETLYSPSER